MIEFAKVYRGELVTETMLVKDINDDEAHVQAIADFLFQVKPVRAYLAIPTRPPAEKWVQYPPEERIVHAFQIFREKMNYVEYLIGYEGNAFAFTGNVEDDLLSITSVHPMREEAVKEFLERAKEDWSVVHKLVAQGQLIRKEYRGSIFYMRKIH
jgi:wyosine [tRNA(Phe)-imidazoG37] synthetase (radical SAM superfamily)